ncbi:MAG: hypothetical protein ABSB69_06575 [Solirubrobacteraceae bacterium]
MKLRLRVYVARGALDRQIAAGRPHESTPALALRARQLTDPRTRQQIARSLRGIVDYADYRASHRVISASVVEPAAVRRARHPILGLAERLEGTVPVNPAGVARAQVLLTDGLSPLYNRNCPRTATQAIYEVQDALEADTPRATFDAVAS